MFYQSLNMIYMYVYTNASLKLHIWRAVNLQLGELYPMAKKQ